MHSFVITLLGIVLFIGWVVPLVIILRHRKVFLPRRFNEIKLQLLRQAPPGSIVVNGDRGKSAAYHYARLRQPDLQIENPKDELAALTQEFWYHHGSNRYAAPVFLIAVLAAIMLSFTGCWIAERLTGDEQSTAGTNTTHTNALPSDLSPGKPSIGTSTNTSVPTRAQQPFDFDRGVLRRIDASFVAAILGALVWSLYEILSRRRTGDLSPVELWDVVLRYLTALPIGYAFSLLVFDKVSPWLAFTVSAFPLRDIKQLLRKQTLRKIGEVSAITNPRSAQSSIGQVISDIGEDTIIRLEELNITTCMELAYADPVGLMIKTGVPIQLVLAWIDKALLAVYAAPHIIKLELLGIPCALDMCEFYRVHCWDVGAEPDGRERDWRSDPAVKDLATKLEIPLELLVPQMLHSLFADPHTQFLIRAWFGPATNKDQM